MVKKPASKGKRAIKEAKPSDPTVDTKKAAKFSKLADGLQKQIDAKCADRLTNTPKRLAQANHARVDGERLKRTQAALYALASLHEKGNVPAVLQHISNKSQVHELMGAKLEHVPNGYHSYHIDTGVASNDSPEARALWELLTPKSEEQKQADALQSKLNGLQFSNIPGYFPTPPAVIEQMLEHADIDAGQTVLEPSAGSGAICDVLNGLGVEISACEVNHTLREILQAKGYQLVEHNFLDYENPEAFDRVMMNPPFEKLQDIDHVRHAYGLLAPMGRLVAIMSTGPFFRNDRKCVAFRDWLEDLAATVHDLPENSFKESGTGVNTKIVVIDK